MLIILSIVICIIVMLLLIMYLNLDGIYTSIFKYTLNKIKHGNLIIYDAQTSTELFKVFRTDEYVGEIYTDDFAGLCKQVVKSGDIGLGEMYMKGEWYSPDMLSLFMLFNKNDKYIQKQIVCLVCKSIRNNRKDIQHHYDVGNDFYMHFLRDDLHAYTCGIFQCAKDDLNTAQYNKVNIIIKKLESEPGQTILDAGCGWGSIANYVGNQTKSTIHGVTLSDEQEKFILQNYEKIKVFNMNILDVPISNNNVYDKIYSIGIMEHIKCTDYSKFFKRLYDLLKPGGRLVLHCITYSSLKLSTCKHQNETFVSKHIFPGGQVPTREWIMKSANEDNEFKLLHMEVYGGQHYARTLSIWRKNMMERKKEIKMLGYSDEFIRKYEYYMVECESAFLSDRLNVTHFVFEKIDDLKIEFKCKMTKN